MILMLGQPAVARGVARGVARRVGCGLTTGSGLVAGSWRVEHRQAGTWRGGVLPQSVAKGLEDYYLGSGEALGRWIGRGSARLGLSGVVDGDGLRAVLDGRRAEYGRSLLWVRRADRLPGVDLTFSAPKGVSLLFALSEDRTPVVRPPGATDARSTEPVCFQR